MPPIRTIVQGVLVVWFITISLLVFVPSVTALARTPDAVATIPPPEPPPPPASAGDEKVIALYKERVVAYQQAATAYAQLAEKLKPASAYEMVVTKTLLPLLDKVVVALVGYAFVVGAATVVNNAILLRHEKEPEALRFL